MGIDHCRLAPSVYIGVGNSVFEHCVAAENNVDGKSLPRSCAKLLAMESDDLYMSFERKNDAVFVCST